MVLQRMATCLNIYAREILKFIEGIPDDENEIVSDVDTSHLVVFDDMLGGKR